MRRWFWISGLIILLGLGYWAWPLASAAHLAQMAETGDAAAVSDGVDMMSLRRSLSRQIAVAYLDASGKGKKLGTFGRSFAGSAVTTVADPYVEELLTPGNITALLAQGRVNPIRVGGQSVAIKGELPAFSRQLGANILSLIGASYFDQIRDFVIMIESNGASSERYGLHMHLVGLTWKLGAIDLPPAIIDQIARSILAGEKPASL